MDRWLKPALDYIPRWIEFQMQPTAIPGCAIAVAHHGRVVFEHAIGFADIARGQPLTPRHRFRAASHSKTFTAAGVMKLREAGRITLDDPIGRHVEGVHEEVARVTIAQLLSHSAGITRDGPDSGQFADRIPYRSEAELMSDLAAPPVIEPVTRFKYSNHGYALLGRAIEAITGEPYARWIAREIVAASGLRETTPGMPARGVPFARGHTSARVLGRRLVIPADNDARAIGPAAGFVATAADLARFFWQIAPEAARSPLQVASRREMTRRHWRNPDTVIESWYGYGTIGGSLNGCDWFGHSGGWQGVLTRTVVVPAQGLSVSVLTNAMDALPWLWADGVLHILRAFAENGPPARRLRGWTGRWWTLRGATDLLPAGETVLAVQPAFGNPFAEATRIAVTRRDQGRIIRAPGFGSHGEAARIVRDRNGRAAALWLGGTKLLPEAAMAEELRDRYEAGEGADPSTPTARRATDGGATARRRSSRSAR
ncbi:MAG TPA: serine hydrolase domain-containing protein [Acetobacteraceae bacterium]|nr:serine hydrolase domain-containing protein [Acetobacteraceae bacterium]